jgi:hypothetical protein
LVRWQEAVKAPVSVRLRAAALALGFSYSHMANKSTFRPKRS